MGGRDHAHVDLDRPGAPQPLELARLQHAQQLGLHLERQLADLVEKERRAVRDLEAPDLARQGPGVGALLPAEQLALHEPGRQRGAVDLDHQAAPARAEPVDGLGDELLAGAGLAANEHRGVRGRDLLHQAQDLLDGGALPGDLAVRVDHPDLGLEVVALRLEPVLQSLDLRVRLPQGLLALPALRDVAEDAERPDRASAGVALGDAGQVVKPLLSVSRMQVAILDGEPLQPAVVQLLALLQHASPVVRMQMLDPEIQGLEALLRVPGECRRRREAGRRLGPCPRRSPPRRTRGRRGRRPPPGEPRLARSASSAALPLGDVDGDAHQALRLAGWREARPPTGGNPPHAAIAREDDPVFHVDGLARARGPLDGSPNEIPVVGMHRGLETLHGDDLVRRVPEDRPSPARWPRRRPCRSPGSRAPPRRSPPPGPGAPRSPAGSTRGASGRARW